MRAVKSKGGNANPSWATRFWAVVKYELLWDIRKKKFIGMIIVAFVFATLGLALPVILSNMISQPLNQNPDYAVTSGAGALGFFLFALVTVMNSISGEFESGTIVPLLTKPISRTMVFLGKLFAAFIILLSTYTVLFLYTTIGATLVYGPQNNLQLVPLTLIGNIFSTFVWIAIVLAIGSLSKSSLIAALGTFGIFIALFISAPIVSVFSEQAWVLTYLPGSGITGTSGSISQGQGIVSAKSISTGTDNIAANLINYVLYPSMNVTFYKIGRFQPGQLLQILCVEPISLILVRSMAVAITYMVAFSLISWYAFKRAQVLE
jgi:ABC-type transport system involved in multi-copper enzyme maturation permease subunit